MSRLTERLLQGAAALVILWVIWSAGIYTTISFVQLRGALTQCEAKVEGKR